MRKGRPRLLFDRAKAQELLDTGLSVRKVALQLGIHHNTLQGHVNRGSLSDSINADAYDREWSYRSALRHASHELEQATFERDQLNQRIESLAETVRVLTATVGPEDQHGDMERWLIGLS